MEYDSPILLTKEAHTASSSRFFFALDWPSRGPAVSAAVSATPGSREIIAALKTVFDPEIPADIYELGLIYRVEIKDDRSVDVVMTLTTPNCPAAGELPTMVENAVASVPGVGVVDVKVVWEPAWSPERMSDEARLVLNMW